MWIYTSGLVFRDVQKASAGVSADILWWLWLRHVSVDVAQEEGSRKSLERESK